MELRYYQEEALAAITTAAERGTRRSLIVLPTGAGKTVIFSHIPDRVADSTPMLILAHREELLHQAKEKLEHANPHLTVAIEQGQNYAGHVDVVVASVPTLGRSNSTRLDGYPADYFKTVVVDEAHHAAAPTYRRVLDHFDSALLVGVTATPKRGDNVGLAEVFDEIIYSRSMEDLIREGFLADLAGYRYNSPVDLSSVKIVRGDYAEGELAAAVNTDARNEAIVESYLKYGVEDARKNLVFCVDVAHAQAVAAHFTKHGIEAHAIWGAMPNEDRRALMAAHDRGDFLVLTNCQIATEGYDSPSIDMITMARPTQSTSLYAQCLDAETEVLTHRGWRSVNTIERSDLVAAPVAETLEMQWERIQEITVRPLGDEAMYGISSPRLDIRVTAGHRMLYAKRRRDRSLTEWAFDRADEVAKVRDGIRIPVAAISLRKDADISDQDLAFLGWWQADGTVNKANGQVSITQNQNSEQYQELITLLTNYEHSVYTTTTDTQWVRSAPCDRFTFRKHAVAHLSEWLDKEYSYLYNFLSPRQWSIFLETLNYGDGNKSTKIDWTRRTYSITVSNETIANRLQDLLVTSGYRVAIVPTKTRAWILHIKDEQRSFVPTHAEDGRANFQQVGAAREETVWCVTNRNGTLITRRNGKVAILGNCVGRGTRLFPGKVNCLVIDVADVSKSRRPVALPSLIGLPLDFDLEGKEITEAASQYRSLAATSASSTYFVKSFSDIEGAWEKINLFTPPPPNPELLEYSNLIWMELGEDNYVLNFDRGDSITIKSDALGTWYVNQGETCLGYGDEMAKAFRFADSWAKEHKADKLKLLSHDAEWRDDPPTDKQIKVLRRHGVPWEHLNKGQASIVIDRIFASNPKPPKPGWLQKKIESDRLKKRSF